MHLYLRVYISDGHSILMVHLESHSTLFYYPKVIQLRVVHLESRSTLLGTSMLEVSSSKPLASESKGFAF